MKRLIIICLSLLLSMAACKESTLSNGDSIDNDTIQNDTPTGDDDILTCNGTLAVFRFQNIQELDPIILHPTACRLYALDRYTSKLIVVDLDEDKVVEEIALEQAPSWMSLNPQGDKLYVSFAEAKLIQSYNAVTGEPLEFVETQQDPYFISAGDNDVVYYVRDEHYSAVYQVDVVAQMESMVTQSIFYEPAISYYTESSLFIAESAQEGGKLSRLLMDGESMKIVDSYEFDGSFGIPHATRHIAVGPVSNYGKAVFFAQRQFEALDLERLKGHYDTDIFAVSPNGLMVYGQDGVYDLQTYVQVWESDFSNGSAAFSPDSDYLYVFNKTDLAIHKYAIADMIGDYILGDRILEAGTLKEYTFVQILYDPLGDRLLGLDARRNLLVYIDPDTLIPQKAEVVGSTPVHMKLSNNYEKLYVATSGANELVIVDLVDDTKVIAQSLTTLTNPYRVAFSSLDQLVYAEQDGLGDLYVFDTTDYSLVDHKSKVAFQPSLDFSEDGQFLLVGESSGESSRLMRISMDSDGFGAIAYSEQVFDYPVRKVFCRGDKVYYAGHKFSLADIRNPEGSFGEDIWAVTPDGTLAFSTGRMYRTSGAEAFTVQLALKVSSGVLAITPDSQRLYQFDNQTGAMHVYNNLAQYK